MFYTTTKYTMLMYDTKKILINNKIHILHRIVANRDIIGCVKKGDLGGYIEYSKNLSPDGDCWVGYYGQVYGEARISGNVVLGTQPGFVDVHNDAMISGDISIYGNFDISGNVNISGSGYYESLGNNKTSISGNVSLSGIIILKGANHIRDNAKITSTGSSTIIEGSIIGDNVVVIDSEVSFSILLGDTYLEKEIINNKRISYELYEKV